MVCKSGGSWSKPGEAVGRKQERTMKSDRNVKIKEV